MKPRNLSEYYKSIGQALPSVQERLDIAGQAGITNYRGSANQNSQLLSYLSAQQPTDQLNLGQMDLNVTPVNLAPAPVFPTVDQAAYVSPDISRDSYLEERQRVQQDIANIEARLNNSATNRDAQYEASGIYDDMRALTELKNQEGDLINQQQDIQRRNIAIPVLAKERLQGRGATLTEFDQTTAPELERNLIRSLTNSSNMSGVSNAINAATNRIKTEQAIIDNKIDNQLKVDELIYKQRTDRLNQIERNYSDILTSEQKSLLEQQKIANESNKEFSAFSGDIVKNQLKILQERGQSIDVNSTPEQISQQYNNLVEGDKILRVDNINSTVETIDKLLSNKDALAINVGNNGLARGIFERVTGAGFSASAKQWRNELKQFLGDQVFQKLASITKESSLGAISDSEIKLVKDAASAISQLSNGKVDLTEKDFTKYMNTLADANKKLVIAEMLGPNKYLAEGIKDIKDSDLLNTEFIAAKVDFKKAATERQQLLDQMNLTEEQAQNLISQGFSQGNAIVSTIKQEEGFRNTAYRDGDGYSIGYGSQRHPDGRPVREGDTISNEQGDVYLQDAINKHSNWKGLVQVPLNEQQQAALASFEFNLGTEIWKGESAQQIMNAINRQDFQRAAQLMQQFNKSQGRTLPVLVARREREGQLLANYA